MLLCFPPLLIIRVDESVFQVFFDAKHIEPVAKLVAVRTSEQNE